MSTTGASTTGPNGPGAQAEGGAIAKRPRVQVGEMLSRYRLVEEVGQGGMAIVYRAQDTGLDREVAVKVLHPHLAGLAESKNRLEREAHAVAKLRHENILEIYDYSGASSPESFLVTEFIHGETLRAFLNRHPLPMPELAEMLASEIARALEHAHSHGVIHRDIKPENVMIRRDDGVVKLMDFGIAQIIDKERMTMTGQLMGSPAYMAPEHIDGKALDFRTDIFALGILTYQLATGQLPFRGRNPHEVLRRIADCKYQPAAQLNPKVGSRLEQVIARCLAKEPGARYPDIGRLRADLLADLENAGLGDVRSELKTFFANPDGYAAARTPAIVKALTERGRKLSAEGRRTHALDLWNRALNYAPKSEELRDAIAGLERRRSAGRIALGGLAALACTGGIGWWWTHRPPVVEPPRPTVAPTLNPTPNPNPIPNPNPVPSPSPTPVPIAAKGPKPTPAPSAKPHPTPTPTPPPTTAPVERTIEISPTPKAATIFLDGKKLGDYGPALTTITLTPGPHSLVLENPYCFPEKRDIAEREAGKIQVRLRWKPATITFQPRPENADILVDGTLAVRGGQPIQFPIPVSNDGRRKLKVHVSANGYEPKTFDVDIRANDVREQALALPPLPN